MNANEQDSEGEVNFQSSKLGTKSHWDSQYDHELKNFQEFGDIGEVWFGEDSVERVSRWLGRQGLPADVAILDLGCGNGASLLSLHEHGFTDLTGVDYSQGAVLLAREIAAKQGCHIKYEVADLLSERLADVPVLTRVCGLLLDKGTYDAISLSPETPELKRQVYKRNVCRLLSKGGLFVLTSCNWTRDELQKHFVGEDFELKCAIPTPKFQFGGSEGSSTSVLVFTKISDS